MARKKHPARIPLILGVMILALLSFMTLGFARYSKLINLGGSVGLSAPGDIYISNVVFTGGTHTSSNPTFTDKTIDFNLTFSGDEDTTEYTANYTITIVNETFYDQVFSMGQWEPRILDSNGNEVTSARISFVMNGLNNGDTIPKGTSVTFTVAITLHTETGGDYSAEGEAGVDYSNTNTGALLASVSGSTTGDLRGSNDYAPFTIHVNNTYDYAQTFSFALQDNNKFALSGPNGAAIGDFTLNANSEADYVVYVSKTSSDFASTYERASIYLTSSTVENVNCGRVTLLVDQSMIYTDTTPPQISNVRLVVNNTNGSATASWNGTDDLPIDHYTVELYDNSNTLVRTTNTTDDTTSLTMTGLSAGTYYVKVYGTDTATPPNTATADDITNAKTTAGACSRSSSVAMAWVFSVTRNLTNLTATNTANTVNRGATYTTTLNPSNGYTLPSASDVTVTMGGKTVSGAYNASSGTITVSNVTGNIVITASGDRACLIKGTDILLADGSTKKIEDIDYNDLLAVWNYETGQLDAAYPVWVERKHTAIIYQRTRFDDGSELKTVWEHGVFSKEQNQFVSIRDQSAVYPGAEIVKVDPATGQLTTAKVVSVEKVTESAEYYHVVSARYYNIIANGFITTDGTTALSNLYGFDENITWPSLRQALMSDQRNLVSYDSFADMTPYYMYVGMRMEEIGVLIRAGALSLNEFRGYLAGNQVNPLMNAKPELRNFDITHLKEPTIRQNQRTWPVSFGDADGRIIEAFSAIEGQSITLPAHHGVSAWHNSIDGRNYLPGETVKILCGTHFTPVNE